MNNRIIFKTSLIITVIVLLSKISGFLRDVALAYAYGTSITSDAFVLSQSVVSIFTALLYTALGLAFIPIYSKLRLNETEFELKDFIDSTYSVMGTIIVVAVIIGLFGADTLVYLLAPGFTDVAHDTAVSLTKILLPSIMFSFITNISGQQLRGNNIFMPTACIAFPLNISLIVAFIFLTPLIGIEGAAYAFVFGTILQTLMLYPFIKKIGYHFNFRFNINNKGLREILILTLPILLGNTIQTINNIVNKILASGLEEGSIAALNFSSKLAFFIVGLISFGAGTVCYTKMSELGAKKEFEALKDFLNKIIIILNLFIVPATFGMMALNLPIIKFVFEYGAFTNNSSIITANALFYYLIGLIFFVLRDIITRAFYAISDSKIPMINGAIALLIGISLNFILVRFMGIEGLALATSLSGVIGTLLLLLSLKKKLGDIGFKNMGITFLKTCIASTLMAIIVRLLYPILFGATNVIPLALLIAIIVGVTIYGLIIILMRIKEVEDIIVYIKKHVKVA